jgi:hypothetical protein
MSATLDQPCKPLIGSPDAGVWLPEVSAFPYMKPDWYMKLDWKAISSDPNSDVWSSGIVNEGAFPTGASDQRSRSDVASMI